MSFEVTSRGHFFMLSMLYMISPVCNLTKLHLLTKSSLTILYTLHIIVNINMQGVKSGIRLVKVLEKRRGKAFQYMEVGSR